MHTNKRQLETFSIRKCSDKHQRYYSIMGNLINDYGASTKAALKQP